MTTNPLCLGPGLNPAALNPAVLSNTNPPTWGSGLMLDMKVSLTGIAAMQEFLLAMQGKANRPAAVALTRTARIVEQRAKTIADRYIRGGPTKWTRNATFIKPAKPDNLVVTMGFKDYSNTGVPAAKYLQAIAAGGTRSAKPFESRLRDRGILGSGQFAIPAGIKPLGLNKYGNLPSPQYTQLLSRMGAMRNIGSMGNATGSKRSKRKQKDLAYFVANVGGHRGIYIREKGNRQIIPAFYFINQSPKYSQTFPIAKEMMQAWEGNFNREFERAIQEEMDYAARKARG
jgi:hypothetical protein